jgi:predicted PurR-regulated permease PerM
MKKAAKTREAGGRADWGFYFRLFLLAAAIVIAGLAIWKVTHLLLLAVGAVLVAVLLRSFANLIQVYTPLRAKASLALATVAIAVFLAAFAFLLGAQVRTQFGQLIERLPELIEVLEERLGVDNIEGWLTEQIQQMVDNASLLSNIAGYSSFLAGLVANMLLVIVAGIYFAADPDTYRRGLLLMLPSAARAEADDTLDILFDALRLWLLGQLISMFLIGALVAIGLWFLGIPSALALGLIAGLLEFIPIIGPILGAVPAIAMGLTEGPATAVWVVGLYVLIQQMEGSVIMPLIQQRMVRLPPPLTIFAILAFGLLFGPLGILFATPLMVISFVLIKKLWIRDTLHEVTELPGEAE